jgi:hypothetical protein
MNRRFNEDAMNDHEKIRKLLSLAAADALDEADLIAVQRHAAGCTACAAELNRWQTLTGALRALPTPQPNAALLERTRALAAVALPKLAEGAPNRAALIFLVAFSSLLMPLAWFTVRSVAGGLGDWSSLRFDLICLSVYGAVTGMTAALSAVVLSTRRQAERSLL